MKKRKILNFKEPLVFKNQQEAATRYIFLFLIVLLLVIITICINMVSFVFIFPHIVQENFPYSIGFIVTALVPMILFFTVLTLFILPILPPSKSNDHKELFLKRNFIKIVNELWIPTTIGYKINRIIRFTCLLIGIPTFLSNLVLMIVGIFLYMVH